MNLYEITSEYQFLMREESLTEELQERLDDLKDSFEDKCFYVGKILRNVESEIAMLELEIDHLESRLLKKRKKHENMSDYIKSNMMIVHKDSLTFPLFDIKIKRNPCKVMIEPNAELPEEYVKEKTTTVIDKQLIKDHLKAGVVIEGCALIQETRLEIC